MANRALYQVLYVDDNPADPVLLQKAFEMAGLSAQVHAVESATQAFEYLEGFRPDLIVMDLRLPMIDGFQALQTIKSRDSWKTIPVVVYSTSRLEADKTRALEIGAAAFFTKPCEWEHMLQLAFEISAKFEKGAFQPTV